MGAANELEFFYVHEVTVELPGVEGPWGFEGGGTSDPVRCFVDDTRRLVRDAQGTEVVSESSLTLPPGTGDMFTVGASVNLPNRVANVISVSIADSGGLDLPDHVQVLLT